MGSFRPRKNIKSRYSYVKVKIPRLPRKIKKELKKNFGPSAYVSWRKSQAVSVLAGKFETVTVQAESRPLRATYTREMADDLEAYYGIDAEATITGLLQRELERSNEE